MDAHQVKRVLSDKNALKILEFVVMSTAIFCIWPLILKKNDKDAHQVEHIVEKISVKI